MSLDNEFNTRLTTLETKFGAIAEMLGKIETKLNEKSKINWPPIAIAVTVALALTGMLTNSLNSTNAVVQGLVTNTTQHTIQIQGTMQRFDDYRQYKQEKDTEQDKRLEQYRDRIIVLEKHAARTEN